MLIQESSTSRLYKDVEFLTSLQPSRNYRNHDSLDAASGYIYQEFAKLGLDSLQYQPFQVSSGDTYKNVSGLIKGKSPERIIIGAHYDVWDDQPGADDNASAVAGLLETARLLSPFCKKQTPALTLEFVGYCLEEPPFFATSEMGSAVHAKQLHSNGCDNCAMAEGLLGILHPCIGGWCWILV